MRRLLVVALLVPAVAGCIGAAPGSTEGPVDTGPAKEPLPHLLAGNVSEPSAFAAPTFDRLGAIASGGPGYGAGEPSIWSHTDGTTYLAFPGCDTAPYLLQGSPGMATCDHGPVYRTDDLGAWTRLNDPDDGRLNGSAPEANGDNDVTVDAAGTVYASNLGGGVQVLRSEDRGESWTYVGDVARDHWSDRQWMAAGRPGQLIVAWMGGSNSSERAVAVNATFDGGRSWTGTTTLGEGIGWLGPVQLTPDAGTAYVPFTERNGYSSDEDYSFDLKVAVSRDGGRTWEAVDTGVDVHPSRPGTHWSGVLMAPALDVTGDGTVVYAYSEEDNLPAQSYGVGATVKAIASTDGGRSWTDPVTVSTSQAAIMPWVTGGAGDRAMINWFASPVPGDSDYVGVWDVRAASLDGLGSGDPRIERATVHERVHVGGICARGGYCIATGSDRALLDFFESDVLPDGRFVVTYPVDFMTGGKNIEIHVAVQDGGSRLFETESTG